MKSPFLFRGALIFGSVLGLVLGPCFGGEDGQPEAAEQAQKSEQTGDEQAAKSEQTADEQGAPGQAPSQPVATQATEPTAAPAGPPSPYDTDNNGLYDDTERKVLVEEFLRVSPELNQIIKENSVPVVKAKSKDVLDFQDADKAEPTGPEAAAAVVNFDADGDGKVTILEMNGDHEPLSKLMPPSFLQSGVKIPWGIDIFPEWLSTAYFKEDVADGPVSAWPSRGNNPAEATQGDAPRQPVKEPGQGIVFAANSAQYLTMPGLRDARWYYRWGMFTFRIDAATGTENQTVLFDINTGEGSSLSSPKVWYDKQNGLSIQYVGTNKGGLDKRVMTAKNVVADGKTWNVAVFGVRQGQMFASVNGVPLATETKQPPRFSGEWPKVELSSIGDASMGNMAWAMDSLIFGLSEPSEAMVRKMTGWAAHRLGFAASLPEGHPYRSERPVLDIEDFPTRYVHDDAKWNEWGKQAKDKSVTRANAGGARVNPSGFQRVFFDDFRADRVSQSTSGEGDLWVGPGFNIAVGAAASLVTPGKEPNAYIFDTKNKNLILAAVQEASKNRWRGSAIYSINDMGWGYTWKGPKIFRLRCMFPKIEQKDLAQALWPAFWSYGTDHLFWRTENRIENDYFELDGKYGSYLNGLSTHFHYSYLKDNIHARNPDSFQRFKVYGGDMSKPESKIPGGFYVWDGKWHTWEYVFDKDWTYVNVSMPPSGGGLEKWVEICRVPTSKTYLEREDLQLCYAFRKAGLPKDGERQDFIIDWVEVLQKTDQVEAAPSAPFTARPALTGAVKPGSTITCNPNLDGITDVRYYWYSDGYPLTYGPDNTYTVTAADVGKPIRCMVQAAGARDQPEAWSNILK